MAYLASGTESDVSRFGFPLIGRHLSLILSGISFSLGAIYFHLHADTDPRWLRGLAFLTILLLLLNAGLAIEFSWQAQMLPKEEFIKRWPWEYVAWQPVRFLIPAITQGYLQWRYWRLGGAERKHQYICFILLMAFACEQFMYLAIVPLSLVEHFDANARTDNVLGKIIIEMYTFILVCACMLDTSLATLFTYKLYKLRPPSTHSPLHQRLTQKTQYGRGGFGGHQSGRGNKLPPLDDFLLYVVRLALLSGFLTTSIMVSSLIWFRAVGGGDGYHLIVDASPPTYAMSFFAALLCREHVRHGLQCSQEGRLDRAVDIGMITPEDGLIHDPEGEKSLQFQQGQAQAHLQAQRHMTLPLTASELSADLDPRTLHEEGILAELPTPLPAAVISNSPRSGDDGSRYQYSPKSNISNISKRPTDGRESDCKRHVEGSSQRHQHHMSEATNGCSTSTNASSDPSDDDDDGQRKQSLNRSRRVPGPRRCAKRRGEGDDEDEGERVGQGKEGERREEAISLMTMCQSSPSI